jgi:Flp pilus assembly protein TadB
MPHHDARNVQVHVHTRTCPPDCTETRWNAATAARNSTHYPAELILFDGGADTGKLAAVRFLRGDRTRSQRTLLTLADWLPLLAVIIVNVFVGSYLLIIISATVLVANVLHITVRSRAAEEVTRPADVTTEVAYVARPLADRGR